MSDSVFLYAGVALIGVFVSSISQVMLKKSALKTYDSAISEYLNPLVIIAYVLFLGTTVISTLAYRVIPLSMGPILDATGYIYVTFFGITVFHEKMCGRKFAALAVILVGIVIYSMGV